MRRAVALCRMSKAINELGNDRQEAAIRANLAQRGIELVDARRDVMSATKYRLNDRPGWLDSSRMVLDGVADMVAVWHLDRLTRDNRDLEDVIDSGIEVTCVTGDVDLATDSGRMVARILVAVAKGEVERKAARQKLSNEQRAQMGRPWAGGARPFGYTKDQMHLVPEEAQAIQWAAGAVLDGRATMGDVMREWTARGLQSSRPRKGEMGFTRKGVRDVLISPRYAGLRSYLGEVIGPAEWPVILDRETHEALKAKLTNPQRRYRKKSGGGREVRNLLTHLAMCGVCGEPLNGSSRKGILTYSCSHLHVSPPRDDADHAVSAAAVAILSDPAAVQFLVPEDDVDAQGIQAELDALHQRRVVIAQTFGLGQMDVDTFQAVTRTLTDQITELEERLSMAVGGAALAQITVGTPRVIDQWDQLDLVHKRAVIGRLFDITALRKAGGWEAWDAEKHLRIVPKKRG